MRARGLATVATLAARGLLAWDNGVPALRAIPPEFSESWKFDHNTIGVVLRRAAVFSQQLATASPDPFVRLQDPKWTAEGCPSYGGDIREHDLGCHLCALAVRLALEGTR